MREWTPSRRLREAVRTRVAYASSAAVVALSFARWRWGSSSAETMWALAFTVFVLACWAAAYAVYFRCERCLRHLGQMKERVDCPSCGKVLG